MGQSLHIITDISCTAITSILCITLTCTSWSYYVGFVIVSQLAYIFTDITISAITSIGCITLFRTGRRGYDRLIRMSLRRSQCYFAYRTGLCFCTGRRFAGKMSESRFQLQTANSTNLGGCTSCFRTGKMSVYSRDNFIANITCRGFCTRCIRSGSVTGCGNIISYVRISAITGKFRITAFCTSRFRDIFGIIVFGSRIRIIIYIRFTATAGILRIATFGTSRFNYFHIIIMLFRRFQILITIHAIKVFVTKIYRTRIVSVGFCIITHIGMSAITGIFRVTLFRASRLCDIFVIIMFGARVCIIGDVRIPTAAGILCITLFRTGRFNYFHIVIMLFRRFQILITIHAIKVFVTKIYRTRIVSVGFCIITHIGMSAITGIFRVTLFRASRVCHIGFVIMSESRNQFSRANRTFLCSRTSCLFTGLMSKCIHISIFITFAASTGMLCITLFRAVGCNDFGFKAVSLCGNGLLSNDDLVAIGAMLAFRQTGFRAGRFHCSIDHSRMLTHGNQIYAEFIGRENEFSFIGGEIDFFRHLSAQIVYNRAIGSQIIRQRNAYRKITFPFQGIFFF